MPTVALLLGQTIFGRLGIIIAFHGPQVSIYILEKAPKSQVAQPNREEWQKGGQAYPICVVNRRCHLKLSIGDLAVGAPGARVTKSGYRAPASSHSNSAFPFVIAVKQDHRLRQNCRYHSYKSSGSKTHEEDSSECLFA